MAGATDRSPDLSSLKGIKQDLYILGAIRFTEAIAWTSIFPYAYFMIESFHEVSSEKLAFYAGLLVSTFTFCEFLGGLVWAAVSDRIGRRLTLIVGLFGGAASAICFGFSQSIIAATLARAIGGITNPNVGLVPTCVAELTSRKEQQAKAFAIVQFLRGLGSLLGPVLGGFLADPVKHHPELFAQATFFSRYPYLLPNLCVALMILSNVLLVLFCLRETHPLLQNKDSLARVMIGWLGGYAGSKTQSGSSTAYAPLPGRQEMDGDDAEDIPLAGDEGDTEACDDRLDHSPPSGPFSRQTMMQICSVSILAFHKVSSDVLMPTYLAWTTDRPSQRLIFSNRGFGLAAPVIGAILTSQAVIAVLTQYFLVSRVIGALGALRAYRYLLSLSPFLYLLTPFLAQAPTTISIVLVTVDLWLKIITTSIAYVCSSILITNTVSSKNHLARVNGAAASLGCLARSLGPLFTGTLFAFGVQRSLIGLPFWALTIAALVGALQSFLLRDHP